MNLADPLLLHQQCFAGAWIGMPAIEVTGQVAGGLIAGVSRFEGRETTEDIEKAYVFPLGQGRSAFGRDRTCMAASQSECMLTAGPNQ